MPPIPVSVWERPGHSAVPGVGWDECCSASSRAMSAAAGQTRQAGSPTPSSPFPEACLFLFCDGCVRSYLLAFLLWQRSLLSQLLQICLRSRAMSIALGHQVLWEMSGWQAGVLQLQRGERLMSSRRGRPGVGRGRGRGCFRLPDCLAGSHTTEPCRWSKGEGELSFPGKAAPSYHRIDLLSQGPDPDLFSPKAHTPSMSAHSKQRKIYLLHGRREWQLANILNTLHHTR